MVRIFAREDDLADPHKVEALALRSGGKSEGVTVDRKEGTREQETIGWKGRGAEEMDAADADHEEGAGRDPQPDEQLVRHLSVIHVCASIYAPTLRYKHAS